MARRHGKYKVHVEADLRSLPGDTQERKRGGYTAAGGGGEADVFDKSYD